MRSPSTLFSPLRFLRCLSLGVALGAVLASPATAQLAESLLPVFGTKGYDFKKDAQPGHDIHGWLPKGWEDNSSWAKVSAVYSMLTDAPVKETGAVRIEVKRRDAHHVQMRPSNGPHEFKKGTTYSITGWLRSPQPFKINVGFREDDLPREYFARDDIETGPEWARFEFDWTPDEDRKAWVMFVVHEPGTVDIAGIVVKAKP
jgi:hypothetical protein